MDEAIVSLYVMDFFIRSSVFLCVVSSAFFLLFLELNVSMNTFYDNVSDFL
jgi:hypothetical protein